MDINPVVDMCKKVDALIRIDNNKTQVTDKPKKKSKGFVVRNISDGTESINKDKTSTPKDYVVSIVKTLRNMETDETKENKDG